MKLKLIPAALLALALLTLPALSGPALASPIPYPIRVTDNSGSLVPGATFAVGATVLTPGTPTSVPAAAGERVLGTGSAPASPVSVTLLDYGTGDYGLVYDPALSGEMYFPLAVSKGGSTITGGAALIGQACSADSSVALTASAASAASAAGIQANGSQIAALPSLLLVTPANKIATGAAGGVSLAPAEHALIGSQDVPAGLTAGGLTSALVTILAAQVARIYGAQWGTITQSGGVYSVAMPAGALTVPVPGSVLGTVAPAYDGAGKPTTTTKTVN